MATFRYVAKTIAGEEVVGVIDALTAVAALDALVGRGLTDVQVTRMRESGHLRRASPCREEDAIIADFMAAQTSHLFLVGSGCF